MSQDITPDGNQPQAPQGAEGHVPHRTSRTTAAWCGEVSAISSAFIEHSTLLKRFLTRFFYQRQDIEDVVQEVYIRAYKAEQEMVIEQPKAFLFRVARNLAMNELKRKSRYIEESIEADDFHSMNYATPALEEEIQARQHLGLYCEAIASLPEQCRRVCLLRKVHGLKHQQIAERLSLTVSSVEKHLRKGALACDTYIQAREDGTAPTQGTTATQSATTQNKPSGTHSVTYFAGRKARANKEPD